MRGIGRSKENHTKEKNMYCNNKPQKALGKQKNRNKKPSDVYKGNGGLTISLGKNKNTLIIRYSLLNGKVDKITINHIPLQKWINVCVILDQRNLDVFLNSKLYASLKLSNIPVYEKKNLFITPHGGFLGTISKFQYFNRQKIGRAHV